MGSMHFKVPGLAEFDPRLPNTAYVSGFEGVPWAGRVHTSGDTLSLKRSIDESGKLQILWPTATRGPLQLSTASLRCDQPPYLLPRELARGSLDRLLQRHAEWSRWGIQPPGNFGQLVSRAKDLFIDSVLGEGDEAAAAAQASIEYELAASRLLCQTFSRTLLTNRNKNEGPLATLLGSRLPTHDPWTGAASSLLPMMNVAWVDAAWHNVRSKSGKLDVGRLEEQCNWAVDSQLRVFAGPLVSLRPDAMQEWFFLMDDFTAIVEAACSYAEEVVKRLRGRVDLWYACTGFNAVNSLNLSEEQVMTLAVSVLETVRRSDETVPVVFGVDMPFGEYLGRHADAISPLHFADAVLRSDLGLSGVVLDVTFGSWPHGTPMVDAIELSNLLDWWASALQVPLVLSVSGDIAEEPPSSDGEAIAGWKLPVPPLPHGAIQGLVRQSNCSQMYEMLSLALAKPAVRGVFWSQPDAATSPGNAAAALVRPGGEASNLLTGLTNLRRRNLM